MLPDDIVGMSSMIIMALHQKDHCIEWQEFNVPARSSQYPQKIKTLNQTHFDAMDALRANGIRQALDDVSVALAEKDFNKGGHPYTPELCSRPEIKRNMNQIKLDLKDSTIIYQQAPVLTNPAGNIAFKTCLEVSPEFQRKVAEQAEKMMHDFGGHFTVEGSHQDKEGAFKNCDFQGCETNDWAECVPTQSAAKAYKAMTDFLQTGSVNWPYDHAKGIACELLAALKAWNQTEAAPSGGGRNPDGWAAVRRLKQ